MNRQGVISLGEAFIDYISKDQTNSNYQRFLGGATVNVAVGTRRLGIPSFYLCKLGTDENSVFIEEQLRKKRVNIDYCISSSKKSICSVYIHLNETGERYFHSYVNQTPDEWLTESELEKELFRKGKIFYFGSGTLFHQTARNTTEKAIDYARENQTMVAFDTNIRLKRWEREETCRETICSYLNRADIVKMTEDELLFLMETHSIDEGIRKISKWNIPFLFITFGKDGACVIQKGIKIAVPGVKIKAVDTTGAGDAFFAAVLYCFHEKGLPTDHAQLKEYLQFANNEGALATTSIGSL